MPRMELEQINNNKDRISQFLELQKCLTLEDLCTLLNYSRRSVQRLLKLIGYYSSFTHNGKWYTLHNVPVFDNDGLWFYKGIGFSKYQDLNATIRHLIEKSAGGLMAGDLSKTLSTSCAPVLNRLYKSNKIDRVKIHRAFVYLSTDRTIKRQQICYLKKTHGLQRPSETDTIVILVEFIRNPNRTFEELAFHLNQKRIFCSADTIKNLFVYYGLEKKFPKMPK